MESNTYSVFVILILLFQTVCGKAQSRKDKKNTSYRIASTVQLKGGERLFNSGGEILNAKADSFAYESFPVIILGMPNKDEAFKEVKKWGVTHVHKYGMGRSIENDQSFFDRAEKYRLKVMSDLRAQYWLKGNGNLDIFRKYITHFKEHPALGFWYLCDEPDNKGIKPGELKPLYQILKEVAPEVPVANAHAWSKNWMKYGDVQDILMFDYYPIYAKPFPENKLNAWTSFMESAFNRGKADNDWTMPILQIFNWKAYAKDGQEKYRNYSVGELRYPDADELRYMIFSSIALGARGVALFSYSRAQMIDSRWGTNVLSAVIKEAKEFVKQVNEMQKREINSVVDQKLLVTNWSNSSNDLILLANPTPDEHKVTLNIGTELNNLKAFKPWGQSRKPLNTSISMTETQLTIDKIMPWEIIILKKEQNKELFLPAQ